jgi:hypothetical protein
MHNRFLETPPTAVSNSCSKIVTCNHDSDWFWTCEPTPGLLTRTEREKSEAGVKRQLDAANLVWEPDVGHMKIWDAEEFVIRMLRSPGGMIFIGGKNLDITPISSPLALMSWLLLLYFQTLLLSNSMPFSTIARSRQHRLGRSISHLSTFRKQENSPTDLEKRRRRDAALAFTLGSLPPVSNDPS